MAVSIAANQNSITIPLDDLVGSTKEPIPADLAVASSDTSIATVAFPALVAGQDEVLVTVTRASPAGGSVTITASSAGAKTGTLSVSIAPVEGALTFDETRAAAA